MGANRMNRPAPLRWTNVNLVFSLILPIYEIEIGPQEVGYFNELMPVYSENGWKKPHRYVESFRW